MPRCRHCDDELPDYCPADVTSCRSYFNWWAQRRGDALTAEEAHKVALLVLLCEMDVASWDGFIGGGFSLSAGDFSCVPS